MDPSRRAPIAPSPHRFRRALAYIAIAALPIVSRIAPSRPPSPVRAAAPEVAAGAAPGTPDIGQAANGHGGSMVGALDARHMPSDDDVRVEGAGPGPLDGPLTDVRPAGAARLAAGGGLVGVWDGFPYTGWLPASPQIAAGPDHLVATVNSRLRIFDKDGALAKSASLRSWFDPVLAPLGIGGFFVTEPWVLYDADAQRFVVTAVAGRADGTSLILLAVSDSGQPIGRWCLFGSDARLNGTTATQTFATTPRTGVNADAVVVTANMFNSADGAFAYAKARFFAKSVVYDRACTAPARWSDVWDLHDEDGGRVSDLRPVLGEGDDHEAFLMNARFDKGASLTRWRVRTDPADPVLGDPPRPLGRATLPTRAYSIAPDAEQPGTSTLVSTGSASLHAVVQRGRSLWTAHTVACDWPGDGTLRACARWYEIGLDEDRVQQSGTFGQPETYVFDPEIMPDAAGNAVVAFNRAGRRVPIEGDFACRRSFAPPGATDAQLVPIVDGQGCYVRLGGSDYNRWGLHNGISLDPVTGRTWIHTAYAYGASADCAANAWRTALADVSCAAIAGPAPTRPGDPAPTAVPTTQPVGRGAGAPTPRPTLAPACRTAVDVLLVLDSSGSIGAADYEVVRAFSRAFVASLGVGPDGAHVGVVQFSDPGSNRLEIALTGDLAALNRTIANMRLIGDSTDMDGGLQIGLDELRANGRQGVPAVMVLVSDGQPNQGDPRPVADAAKAAGIRLLTIGVGTGIDADLMRALASPPADATFFFAEEFDALMELLEQLVVNLCPSPAPPPPPSTSTPDARLRHRVFLPLALDDPTCPPANQFVDVALVLDASTSMLLGSDDGRPKYEVALDAARRFAAGLRLRPAGDQLAVLAFNDEDRLLQPLTGDRDRLDAVLRTFTPIRATSRLELGVRRATAELSGARHRPGHMRAIVVLSDGRTNPSPGADSVAAAAEAKAQGIAVYVVGMGPDMDESTLRPMASDPSRFLPAASDRQLEPIFRDLVGAVSCPPEIYWSRRP